jgi:beta-lactamase class A
LQEDDIQDYGTGSLRYEEPGGVYSLKALTKLALEQSDNTAAYILGNKLGRDNIQQYAKSLGLVATNMDGNRTSARDMGLLLEHIWTGKVTNTALKLELLDFMKDTDFEDRLARDIPKNVAIHHKAADGTGFVHDVGIINDGKRPFVLAVMISDTKNEEEAKKTIGKIAAFLLDQP